MLLKMRQEAACCEDVVFMPALTPLEAVVLPAQERAAYGVLHMVRHAYDAGISFGPQRAKIWVR